MITDPDRREGLADGEDDDWSGPDSEREQQEPEPPPGPDQPHQPTHPRDQPQGTACSNCDHPLPAGHPPTDGCPLCASPVTHLVLLLAIPDAPALHATAAPGRPLRLGRDPLWGSQDAVAALSVAFGVSRRHATITMDTDGAAWLTDDGSRNGTWLNGHLLEPPGAPHALAEGDQIALGQRVRGTVTLRLPWR